MYNMHTYNVHVNRLPLWCETSIFILRGELLVFLRFFTFVFLETLKEKN